MNQCVCLGKPCCLEYENYLLTNVLLLFSGIRLHKRIGGDEACDQARIHCFIEEV